MEMTTKIDTWDESLINQSSDNHNNNEDKQLSSKVCHKDFNAFNAFITLIT